MPKLRHIFLFAAILLVSISAFGQKPSAAVTAFYKFDRSHSQTFNRKNIDARKQWFSAELYGLFLNELKRERAYLRKNPTDKPYFGDGLPFQPIDENCGVGGSGVGKRLKVQSGVERARTANVKAIFAFPKPCKEPDTTVYTIKLVKVNNAWLIDDVAYEDNHSLKQDLRRKDY